MREAVAFLLLACACGAASWSSRPAEAGRGRQDEDDGDPRQAHGANSAGDADNGGGGDAVDRSFVGLEARAGALAPGMRRATERESTGERVELLRAVAGDACVRVTFGSSVPIIARLLTGDGMVLAETPAATTDGALGDRGPVCIRKGDTVSAVAEGAAGRVRWVAWASP